MDILPGQFIPKDLPTRRDVIFLGEKPSLHFVRHPKDRNKGNYNATTTDFVFHNWIRKYMKRAVYVTDMVKTEGRPGADFKREWNSNPRFVAILLEELKKYKPKIIVAMSRKVLVLFQSDPRLDQWRDRVKWIYHPSYVTRFKEFAKWDKQFKNLIRFIDQSK